MQQKSEKLQDEGVNLCVSLCQQHRMIVAGDEILLQVCTIYSLVVGCYRVRVWGKQIREEESPKLGGKRLTIRPNSLQLLQLHRPRKASFSGDDVPVIVFYTVL